MQGRLNLCEDVFMKRRDIGKVLMAAGVMCLLFYVGAGIGLTTSASDFSTLVAIVDLVALIAGVVFYGLARSRAS